MKNFTTFLFCCLALILSSRIQAQDRFFAFTTQSNVLPKGTRAVEIWYTGKYGGQVFYNSNLTRVGLKLGLGNNILTQFYANLEETAQIESHISHIDKKTRLYSPTDTRETDISFSNETKIKLLDPIANAVGLALYNEFTIGSHFTLISPKLVLDKRVGDNFFVFNTLFEYVKRKEGTTTTSGSTIPSIVVEKEQTVEFGFGYLRFSKSNKFGIGFEAKSHNEILPGVGWEHSALFMGPALHFRDDKWFINITGLSQLANLRKTWLAPDSRVLDEHQKFELRAQIGFMF